MLCKKGGANYLEKNQVKKRHISACRHFMCLHSVFAFQRSRAYGNAYETRAFRLRQYVDPHPIPIYGSFRASGKKRHCKIRRAIYKQTHAKTFRCFGSMRKRSAAWDRLRISCWCQNRGIALFKRLDYSAGCGKSNELLQLPIIRFYGLRSRRKPLAKP